MRVDVMIQYPPEGQSHTITVLDLTDDGLVVAGRRKTFPGVGSARGLRGKLHDHRDWDALTAAELDEVRRIRERAKPVGKSDSAP